MILNFVGNLLKRQRHQLKSYIIHEYFLQRLVVTSIGKYVSLLYPKEMLLPSIFWLIKEKLLVGSIPDTLLNDNIKRFGFSQIPQHIHTRLTYAGYQTIINKRYTAWSYDIMTNLATNKNET